VTTRSQAGLATIFVLALAGLSWLAIPGANRDLSAIFTPEHVTFLGTHDTRAQQRSYRFAVAAVAVIALAGAARAGTRTARSSPVARRLERIVRAIDAGGAIVVIGVASSGSGRKSNWSISLVNPYSSGISMTAFSNGTVVARNSTAIVAKKHWVRTKTNF